MKTFIIAAGFLGLIPAAALAQPAEGNPQNLPVRAVTLFTSGVSYTERAGEVNGDASIPLTFRTAQINDILKSLVLIDERGKVQPATYAAKDPITRTLQAFPVDVSSNLTMEQLLSRLRGQRVTIETGKEAYTGSILGVETRPIPVDDVRPAAPRLPTATFVTLLTDKGIVTLRVDSEMRVRILDERLNKELQEALGILARGQDDQRRQVVLHFTGTGRRQVRVGYVTEAPLWKMSYRLVLGSTARNAPPNKGYMQGWALVENTSEEDWNAIRLSLVSGRPVSFIQDLYQPLYIPRPIVPPDVIASPYPQTHGGDLQEKAAVVAGGAAGGFGARGGGAMGAGVPPAARRPRDMAAQPQSPADAPMGVLGYDLDNSRIMESLSAMAQGEKTGELFEYAISTPVTLPRQQAAMIPVVAQDIEAEKLSLYNADSDRRYPLNAVRLKNSTELHLKGGPITLFDGSTYAGDARMEDIPPGDSRLVTYAVDLSIEGERQGPGVHMHEMSLSLKRGVLTVVRKETIETTYTIKSKAEAPKTVLVEHPFQSEYKLVTPDKAAERSARYYRFAVNAAPGKSQTLKVAVERPISMTVAVFDADINSLGVYAGRKDISPKLRETLQEVIRRRRQVGDLKAQALNREQEIGSIMQDQDRLRKNMAALDRMSALYKRYVSELDAQETRIQALRTEMTNLRKQSSDAERELRNYLDELVIES